jgi:hypothetical protein
MTSRLTKSRFVAGWQCPKLLWWSVHEPLAPELEPDIVLRDLFDQGALVDARARREWPEGVRIDDGAARDDDRDARDAARAAATQAAIEANASVIFGAVFDADGVFCVVDALERNADGWTLIEVKSASEAKDYHLPDVAVQVHVARRCGVNVTRAEVMHLNREYRHPDHGPLFTRTDVSAVVSGLLDDVADRIPRLHAALDGPLPDHPVGEHCWFHGECAFFNRCWPGDEDHIRHLCNVGPRKTLEWMAKGIARMSDLPAGTKLNEKQQRQLKAQRENRLIVEPGLGEAIRPAVEAKRLGFLDFETVSRALPVWNGLGPWHQTAAQFSYHERQPDGTVTHVDFLAEGPDDPRDPPDDPREAIARAMLAATANADRIVMYTPFERTQIKALATHLPHLAPQLAELVEKLWDLKPPIEQHVYHPRFRGSFSLKDILNPLVPDLSYNDLVIIDGKTASVEIARLLFVSGRIPLHERETTRRNLLDYCKRDTFATVRLVDRLIELAAR